MADNLTTSGITGSDGGTPIYDPEGTWRTWSIDDIWMGPAGPGNKRYVPKVKDWIVNPETSESWIVVALNPTTLVPQLKKLTAVPDQPIDELDVLLGVGPGPQSQCMRAYLNNRVNPHTLTLEQRLTIKSDELQYVKIYRGSQIDGDWHVVGLLYDQGGQLLGDSIPVKLAEKENGENHAVYFVPSCHTREAMPNGTVLTVVGYGDNGIIVSKSQVLVENTGYIPTSDAGTKYITDISLKSPWLSPSDPSLLLFPLNVPFNSLNMLGVVHFSDGSTRELPVDGSRFRMDGFQGYISSQAGQDINLVLQYTLAENEVAVNTSLGPNRTKSKAFTARTTKVEGQYTPKLYPAPVWIDAVNGYRLEWFFLNLDRNICKVVTPYVKYNTNRPAFDPVGYGRLQRLAVQIRLSDVSAAFKAVLHPQTVEVSLMAQGTETGTNWTIGYDPNQSPPYGVDIAAKSTFINQNLWKVKIDQGKTNLNDWLDVVYWATRPLRHPTQEVTAPTPDWFSFVFGDREVEFPISQWSSELTLSDSIPHGSTLFVKFFKRTPQNDIVLALAPMAVHQQN